MAHAERELAAARDAATAAAPSALPEVSQDRRSPAALETSGRRRRPRDLREPRVADRCSPAPYFCGAPALRRRKRTGRRSSRWLCSRSAVTAAANSIPASDVDVMFLHPHTGDEMPAIARADGRADSLFALGHRFQSRPFHSLGARSDRAGQSRHADQNRDARVAASGRRRGLFQQFPHAFPGQMRAGTREGIHRGPHARPGASATRNLRTVFTCRNRT